MRLSSLGGLALLASCGQPAPVPRPTATARAADGYGAKVAALPVNQRTGVLLRAIMDAGQDCQRVIDSQAVPDAGAAPAWIATCDDHRVWVVAVADDGTATVADARTVQRQH